MALRDIVTYPEPVLSTPAREVTEIGQEIQDLADDMAETMYAAPGVGLAAPQVGCGDRVIVFDAERDEEGDKTGLVVLVNPRIVAREGSITSEGEGCLSVPDFRADVHRAACVTVEAVDRHGKPVRLDAEGFLAVVLQHEIDHLDGVLFIDRISSLKRNLYKRRVKKMLKQS